MTDISLPSQNEPRRAPMLAGVALLVGVIAGVVWWATHRDEAAPTPPAAESAATAVVDAVADAGTPHIAEVVVPPVPAGVAAAPPPSAELAGMHVLKTTIDGPLERAVVQAVGQRVGAPLTQVVTRTLVWWLRVPDDLLKGDTLTALYEERAGQEPLVHAVRFTSRKLGRTFEAYRYQSSSAPVARFYAPDGSELEERFVDSPLDSWDQITSLLRDGRRHQGVDFKAPVGTPVRATFDGVIARKNWGSRRNGNCLELRETGGTGTSALFLHLAEVPRGIEVGKRVKKGDVIATSGNTGHSFAPHLHYQLMRGATVLDPFKVHPTTRVSLVATERAAFEAYVTSQRAKLPLDGVLGG